MTDVERDLATLIISDLQKAIAVDTAEAALYSAKLAKVRIKSLVSRLKWSRINEIVTLQNRRTRSLYP